MVVGINSGVGVRVINLRVGVRVKFRVGVRVGVKVRGGVE